MVDITNTVSHLESVELPELLKGRLQQLAKSRKVAHLWVFVCPDCDTATDVGRAFLLDWLASPCGTSVHPDLVEVKTSGKIGLHSIASIRYMLEQLALSPHGTKGRAVLIDAADRMLPATANALLKALEEPPPSTVIILTSSSPHLILPTILSRAQVIRIPCHRQGDTCRVEQILTLLRRGTPVAYSTLMAACESVQKEFEKEQAQLAKQLSETRGEERAEQSSAAKQEAASEVEGNLALWSQNMAKKLIEDLYLAMRDLSAEEDTLLLPQDPVSLSQLLLQALNGIDRGADLSTMLLWFVTQAYSQPKESC